MRLCGGGQTPAMIEIRPSARHGRGLFAVRRIPGGTLVSTAPALLVDNDTRLALGDSPLAGMFVDWDDDGTGALPLGAVSLVNHAAAPNCEIALLVGDEDVGPAVELWTLSAIAVGEELTVDYVAGDPGRPLWFDTTA